MKDGCGLMTDKNRRRFVAAADVAEVTGLGVPFFNMHAWPANWQTPRDYFQDARGHVWFALLGLSQLADWLLAFDQGDAALKLREWSAPWIAAAIAEQSREAAGAVAFAGSGGAVVSGDSRVLGCPSRTAAAPAHPGAAEGWARNWESEHEL